MSVVGRGAVRRCFRGVRSIALDGRRASTICFAGGPPGPSASHPRWQVSPHLARSKDLRRPQPLLELFNESPAGRCAKRLQLHQELCVRINWAIQQLQNLPAGLSQASGVAHSIRSYKESLEALTSCTSGTRWVVDEVSVFRALKECFETRTNAISLITVDLRDLQSRVGMDHYNRYFRQSVDAHLEHFFAGHVGIRFLKHQLMRMAERATSPVAPRPTCGRSVTSSRSYSTVATHTACCNPVVIANTVARKCEDLCQDMLGRAVEVVVKDKCQVDLQFWPAALHYALCEVVKNACKAVAARYSDGFEHFTPPVVCSIEGDDRWLRITVKDEGSGIPPEQLEQIWGFAWSGPVKTLEGTQEFQNATRLSGYGVGLPLSRLYLRYFGGDIQVTSVRGRGTTVHLLLDRHSSRYEESLDNIPSLFSNSVQQPLE